MFCNFYPWGIWHSTFFVAAQFGGVLGLCLGASLLSGIELIYYFTIRILMGGQREAKTTEKQIPKRKRCMTKIGSPVNNWKATQLSNLWHGCQTLSVEDCINISQPMCEFQIRFPSIVGSDNPGLALNQSKRKTSWNRHLGGGTLWELRSSPR